MIDAMAALVGVENDPLLLPGVYRRSVPLECMRCGRILFTTRRGLMPPHKVPEPSVVGRNSSPMTPLTGSDAEWCVK